MLSLPTPWSASLSADGRGWHVGVRLDGWNVAYRYVEGETWEQMNAASYEAEMLAEGHDIR